MYCVDIFIVCKLCKLNTVSVPFLEYSVSCISKSSWLFLLNVIIPMNAIIPVNDNNNNNDNSKMNNSNYLIPKLKGDISF